MIDIRKPKCEYENCNSRPSYNLHNLLNAIRCSKHKLINMVDVVNKKCEFKMTQQKL